MTWLAEILRNHPEIAPAMWGTVLVMFLGP